MDPRIIVIIAILIIVTVISTIYLLRHGKKNKPVLISDSLIELFDSKNILNIEFVRNKIVVSFKDVSLFEVNKLKEYGGKGISVIGDKIKFFVSDKPHENENLYNDLLKLIER